MADGNSFALPFDRELVVDLFAGGGGASTGMARAYREPDIAVNHNAIAIAVHRANHPHTEHYIEDVFDVDPIKATRGRPVGVLWASPDCRHHSKAKGGKPRDKRIRGLAWVVLRWALAVSPRLIELENVEEFIDWCPLDDDGNPIKARRGETFKAFVAALSTGLAADHPAMAEIIEFLGGDIHVPALVRGLGYCCDHMEIRACDYGAPTIRKRLYFKARRDRAPITWPKPTHAKGGGGLLPWRTAAECLDFNLPARSIFDRPKPLAVNTQRRVAKGLWRYVLTAAEPFIVHATHHGERRTHAVDAPMPTITAANRGELMLADAALAPFVAQCSHAADQRSNAANEPLRTLCAQVKGGHFALTAAHITKFRFDSIGTSCNDPLHTITAGGDMARPAGAAHAMGLVAATMVQTGYGERIGQAPRALDIGAPLGTVVAGGVKHAAVQAHFLEQANGGFYDGEGRGVDLPVSTVCTSGANQRLISAYLVKYYGNERDGVSLRGPMHTLPTKDRMGLVEVVQVPTDGLAPEHRARAKACADFLHEHLPEHFPEPADLVLVGDYVLVDITLRMLVPRELARAQGFPDSYILDRGLFETAPGSGTYEWRPITKTDQVRLIGNSVCPDVAEAIVRHDLDPLIRHYARAA